MGPLPQHSGNARAYGNPQADHVAILLDRLRGVLARGDTYDAYCPAHEDKKRSLTVRIKSDGVLLVNCHAGAGCPLEAIMGAMGLTLRDLYPPERRTSRGARKEIVATYDYRDPDDGDRLLYQVVRWDPKGFSQRCPDGVGGWVWNLQGVKRVLYRLRELRDAPPAAPIYVAEGEKDAETLRAWGLVATTNPGGAAKWRPEYTAELVGHPVVLCTDNDPEGAAHVEAVATACYHGKVASVQVVRFRELEPKGDVSDWAALGHTKAEFLARVAATSPWEPSETATLRAENARLKAQESAQAAIDARPDLKSTVKIVWKALLRELAHYQTSQDGTLPDAELSWDARRLVAKGYRLCPTIATLVNATGRSPHTVERALKVLVDKGLLDRKIANTRRDWKDEAGVPRVDFGKSRAFVRFPGDAASAPAVAPVVRQDPIPFVPRPVASAGEAAAPSALTPAPIRIGKSQNGTRKYDVDVGGTKEEGSPVTPSHVDVPLRVPNWDFPERSWAEAASLAAPALGPAPDPPANVAPSPDPTPAADLAPAPKLPRWRTTTPCVEAPYGLCSRCGRAPASSRRVSLCDGCRAAELAPGPVLVGTVGAGP
jgi:hypothetical protein